MLMANSVDVDKLAALFDVTFTDREKVLLTSSRDLLSHLDRQRAYLLHMALTAMQCPACSSVICQRSAAPDPDNFAEFGGGTPDDSYVCPHCGSKLTWRLGLFAGQMWFVLNPGQTVTTR